MGQLLSLLERFRTPITVILVIGLLAMTGLFAAHSSLAQQLVARTTNSSDDQILKELAAKQQAIMEQLASIELDAPAGLPVADSSEPAPTTDLPITTSSPTSLTATPSGLVHLNSADETTLETLPDIGPSKAQAIVEYRTAHGRFAALDELDNVKGIGEATLAKLRPHLILD